MKTPKIDWTPIDNLIFKGKMRRAIKVYAQQADVDSEVARLKVVERREDMASERSSKLVDIASVQGTVLEGEEVMNGEYSRQVDANTDLHVKVLPGQNMRLTIECPLSTAVKLIDRLNGIEKVSEKDKFTADMETAVEWAEEHDVEITPAYLQRRVKGCTYRTARRFLELRGYK